MGRGTLLLCLALSACSSREVFRHDLEVRGWELAFLQALDEEGRPRGPFVPFVDGAAAHELAEDEAGFVVFGLATEALPVVGGRILELDSGSISFSAVELAHPGSDPYFGFDGTRARLLLEPDPESPYLDVEGPRDLAGAPLPAGYLGAFRLGLPHAQTCPSDRPLVELEDVPFALAATPFAWVDQIVPIDAEVALLRGTGVPNLVRVRRGEPVTDRDVLSAWSRSASLAADLEDLAVASAPDTSGRVSIFVAAQDKREGRELEGVLFHAEVPLRGPLDQVPVEALELPVDPELGYVPRLRGVAVAADGTVLVVGGWEGELQRPGGYYAVRPAGASRFTRLELGLLGGPNGARGRAASALDRAGAPSVFAVGTSSGELLLLSFEGATPSELPTRLQLYPDDVSTRPNMDWRGVWLRPRGVGFEVWGSARDGVLAQRHTDGRWSLAGDLIRDRQLAPPELGACARFGQLSQVEPDGVELLGEEVFLAFRRCASLVRVVLDQRRDPICAGAVSPGQALGPGFGLRALARWGDELVAAGEDPTRLLRLGDRP